MSLTLAVCLAVASASPVRPLHAPGEILVRATSSDRAPHVARALGGEHTTDHTAARRGGWLRVGGDETDALMTAALELDDVDASEPNYYLWSSAIVDHGQATWIPDDPHFDRQWNLAGAASAWYETRGATSVIVAVLDSGLRIDAAGEQPLSVLPGWDFVDDDDDPDDGNGHGTHIASIIAQSTDNGHRAAGLSPDASILPVRVLDDDGRGTALDVAEAIYWATDAGADVINLSLAMSPLVRSSAVLADAVRYAATHDVILVAAAGNDGAGAVSLPAALNAVIAVGAVTSAGDIAAYSNYGPALDLAAPGGDDVDRDGDGDPDGIAAWAHDGDSGPGLYLGAGTSQAAAHVSGAAALLLSLGEHGRDRVRSLLTLGATDLGGDGWDAASGHGQLAVDVSVTGRRAIATSVEHRLSGWVRGQDARGQNGLRASDLVGALALHDGQLLLVMGDRTGVLGFVDLGQDRVGVFELRSPNIVSALRSHGGLLALIDSSGGILGLVDSTGGFTGAVDAVGGILGLVDSTGGFTGAVDAVGGLLALIDSTGGLLGLLDVSGGFTGAVDAVGGLMAILDGSGRLMALIEAHGGLLGLLDSTGGLLALVDSTGGLMGLVDGTTNDGLLGPGLVPVRAASGSARHR